MATEPTLWSFISNAGPVVQCVMLVLIAASITSWTIILQRTKVMKESFANANRFEKHFWSEIELSELFKQIANHRDRRGLVAIFYAGMNEFMCLREQGLQGNVIMEGVQRAMYIASNQEIETLQNNLAFLATVGSTSPYIGLFGTVWGIMSSFRALGSAQQATIALVAPGISEALIATAIGLFAAIPAVIAYNRFNNKLDRLASHYDRFQEELTNILHREAYKD